MQFISTTLPSCSAAITFLAQLHFSTLHGLLSGAPAKHEWERMSFLKVQTLVCLCLLLSFKFPSQPSSTITFVIKVISCPWHAQDVSKKNQKCGSEICAKTRVGFSANPQGTPDPPGGSGGSDGST